MRVIKFDYFIKPVFIKGKITAIYYPIIPVNLSSKFKIYPASIDCIIDSGSDFTLFPASIGEKLNLNIKKGEKVTHKGIGGYKLFSYRHAVSVYLENHKIQTDIHFCYEHKIPILGRYGFFNHFKKIVFNEKELQVEMHY